MKWEEEGYTRKDEHGNIISVVSTTLLLTTTFTFPPITTLVPPSNHPAGGV